MSQIVVLIIAFQFNNEKLLVDIKPHRFNTLDIFIYNDDLGSQLFYNSDTHNITLHTKYSRYAIHPLCLWGKLLFSKVL